MNPTDSNPETAPKTCKVCGNPAFIEWVKLPRGTYQARVGYKVLEVWAFARPSGITWKWTISDADCPGCPYLDCGEEMTLDMATEIAIAKAEGREVR